MAGKLKPYKYPTKAGGAYRRTKARVTGATSKPASRTEQPEEVFRGSHRSTDRFGEKGSSIPPRIPRSSQALTGGYVGLAGGGIAGAGVYGAQTGRDQKVLSDYKKKKISKARAHLITDVGTAYGRQQAKRWPGLKVGAVAGGATVGTGLGVGTMGSQKVTARGELERKYKAQERRKKKALTVSKAIELERYKITPQERRKDRAKSAAQGTAVGGALYGAHRYANNKINTKMLGTRAKPYSGKHAAAVAGGIGALSAAGKYEKTQYRTVKKSSTSAFGVDHG